ncbi:MAG: hypothetical protein ACK5PZ_14125, partial [Pirellula sp.]
MTCIDGRSSTFELRCVNASHSVNAGNITLYSSVPYLQYQTPSSLELDESKAVDVKDWPAQINHPNSDRPNGP